MRRWKAKQGALVDVKQNEMMEEAVLDNEIFAYECEETQIADGEATCKDQCTHVSVEESEQIVVNSETFSGENKETQVVVDEELTCTFTDKGNTLIDVESNALEAVVEDTEQVEDSKDIGVNTDLSHNDATTCTDSLQVLEDKSVNTDLVLIHVQSPSDMLRDDDCQTHFYTGLLSYSQFKSLLGLFTPVFPNTSTTDSLSLCDQFLLVLMKTRLAIPHEDLSYRFRITISTVSKVFHRWIDVMARELKRLIVWPDRDLIRKNLPTCFKTKYPNAACIIDCSEIFLQRPSSLLPRGQTYSNYKHHNTVKFFIAISPTGAIIFLSKCWGGRISDKSLTKNCGFYHHLLPGDLILADRGFNISEDLALHGASLVIPSFTKGKIQLSQHEVEVSRSSSSLRIHVERAIGRLKNYKILQSTLPISLVKISTDVEYATIDKILIVCAALCNLQPSLVK